MKILLKCRSVPMGLGWLNEGAAELRASVPEHLLMVPWGRVKSLRKH